MIFLAGVGLRAFVAGVSLLLGGSVLLMFSFCSGSPAAVDKPAFFVVVFEAAVEVDAVDDPALGFHLPVQLSHPPFSLSAITASYASLDTG